MLNSTESAMRPESPVDSAPEMETKLARLWAEVLERKAVDLHDDYFALGGNSLLAVRLFARIATDFGVKLPLASIIEAPTVAQFARLLETQGSHNPVVLIREGGNEPPLFLVHDADGETMLYRSLSLHLDPAHAVYGLQPYSKPDHPILHTNIEEMAAFHIASIRRIQGRGPYLIGGLCAGGLIAYEMARQLERAGDSVAMVALMDVADVAAKGRPLRLAKQRLTRLASTFDQGKGDSKARRAARVVRTIARKAGNFARYAIESRTQMIRDQTRMRLFRLHLKLGLRMPSYLRLIPVRTVYNDAKSRYQPTSPVGCELLLLRASGGSGDDEAYANRYADPLMGWNARTTQGVRAVDVPGGHSSMLQEPHVQAVSEHITKHIEDYFKKTVPAVGSLEKPSLTASERGVHGGEAAETGHARPVGKVVGEIVELRPLEARSIVVGIGEQPRRASERRRSTGGTPRDLRGR